MKPVQKKTLVAVTALMIATAVVTPFTQHNGVSIGEEVGASKATSIAKKTMQTSANLNMRTTASTKGKVLLTIPKGTKVTTNSKVGSWYKVAYKGKTGFVSGSYLKSVKSTVTPPKAKPKAKPKATAKPAPKATATKTTYATTAGLNLRSGASTKHKVLLTIPKGKAVTYVSKSGSWTKVKYGSKTGFVSTKYLKSTKVAVKPKPKAKPTPKPAKKPVAKPVPKATATKTTYTTTAGLNLRSGASTKHKILLTIPKGKAVSYVSKSGSWTKVKYGSKTGFVSTKYLKSTKVAVKPKPKAKPTPKPAKKPVTKPKPKPIPKAPVSWITQKEATSILGKVMNKGTSLTAYGESLVSVGFYNKTNAQGGIHVDAKSYISSFYITPESFGQATYKEEKEWLKKMDKAILAFSETQVGVGTSASKKMTSDFKSFIINSKRDAKVLKTYNGKTYELWNMSGAMQMNYKK